MAQLVVKHGPQPGATYVIERENVVIGRDRSSDICVRHETVSRAHARLTRDATGCTVIDLESSNGTFVNGIRVSRERIHHMDEIQFGDVVLVFLEDTPALFRDDGSAPEITQVLDSSTLGTLRVCSRAQMPRELEETHRSVLRLFEFSTAAGACRTLPELMTQLTAAATEALHADRLVPITVEPGGVLRPWFGRRSASNTALAELPISLSIVNYVRSRKESVRSEVRSDARFSASASVVRNEIAAAMCVPLVSGGREIGAIYADRIAPAEPFTETDLRLLAALAMPVVVAIENIRATNALKTEHERLVDQMKLEHSILGKHPSVLAVLELVERVAATDSNVLITGESGTGKELVARAIHLSSQRSGRAFEAVNCAALAPTLLESELFGHVKGAFTGAINDRPGRFELADKGTLFLDEIGEMPLDSQAKLLRVIEQGELRRVGDTRDRTVDVRILAATNKQLDKMVVEHRFREDLFYRLNIVRIELPPLRSRVGDIDLLADHFLRVFCSKCGRKPLTLAARARELLNKYSWPGNVRELKNVIERLAVICKEDEVRPEDLPHEIFIGGASARADVAPTLSLAEVERKHILDVLAHTSGNKKEAAAILGIDRSTLYAKLKQYGIE